jgi:hypothetical protein
MIKRLRLNKENEIVVATSMKLVLMAMIRVSFMLNYVESIDMQTYGMDLNLVEDPMLASFLRSGYGREDGR